MRRGWAVVGLLVAASPAGAQNLPPALLGPYSVGHAQSILQRADPCFPGTPGEADLRRMMAAAQARIQGPEQQEAYWLGERHASQQQRHIPRSDPVACGQVRAGLGHFLAQGPR